MPSVSLDPFAPDPTPGSGCPDSASGAAPGSGDANAPSFAAMLAAIRQGVVVAPNLATPPHIPSTVTPGLAPAGPFVPEPFRALSGLARRPVEPGPGAAFLATIHERTSRLNLNAWLARTLPSTSPGGLSPAGDVTASLPTALAPSEGTAAPAPNSGLGALDPLGKLGSIAPDAGALPLSAYPRPENDNGRGIHWVTTLYSTPAVVDRFVDEATKMGIKRMAADQFRCMEQPHEPYYFAATYWVIANAEGGGHDLGFEHQALFQSGSVSPVVAAVENLA